MGPRKEHEGACTSSWWKSQSWTRRSSAIVSLACTLGINTYWPSPALASHLPSPFENNRALTHDLCPTSFLVRELVDSFFWEDGRGQYSPRKRKSSKKVPVKHFSPCSDISCGVNRVTWAKMVSAGHLWAIYYRSIVRHPIKPPKWHYQIWNVTIAEPPEPNSFISDTVIILIGIKAWGRHTTECWYSLPGIFFSQFGWQ
jgi:hypothetical protein